jgi:hypothetical protein
MQFALKTVVFTFLALLATRYVHAANLRVTWEDTSNNEDGFTIERVVAGLVDTTISVGINSNSYTDSGLINGTIYCYRIIAFNSAGNSDPSNEGCATAEELQSSNTAASLTTTTLTVNPTTIAPTGTITASWSGMVNPTTTDWIGVYVPGASDVSFLDWFYVSCSKSPGTALAAGSCSYALPSTTAAGSYELRLYANDSFARLRTSNFFALTTGTIIPSPIVSVSPAMVGLAGTASVSWSGIISGSPRDWLGLYTPAAEDMSFLDWIYVSCSKTAETARTSGSCTYSIPSTVMAGNYELRLYANDGFNRLAKSNPLTIESTNLTARPSAPSSLQFTPSP